MDIFITSLRSNWHNDCLPGLTVEQQTDIYITCLKSDWHNLNYLPILTVEQIKSINNDCARMYLYIWCDHPNFYNYKKKLLNRYINKKKDNLLLFAAALGKINVLKYLVSCGFDINYKNEYHMNAYIAAAEFGQLEMLKYLNTIINNKNIKKKNININYAYLYAARNGHIHVLKYLESLNFDIYKKYDYGDNLYQKYYKLSYATRVYLENKFLYKSYSKICSICYKIKDNKFITCKNNHIVHLKCQQKHDRNRCLMCSSKYVI
jgi:hypothetical protein